MKLQEAFAKRKTYASNRIPIRSPSIEKARDAFVKIIQDKGLDKYIHDMMDVYVNPHKHPDIWDEGPPPRMSGRDIVDVTIDQVKDTIADEFLFALDKIK